MKIIFTSVSLHKILPKYLENIFKIYFIRNKSVVVNCLHTTVTNEENKKCLKEYLLKLKINLHKKKYILNFRPSLKYDKSK